MSEITNTFFYRISFTLAGAIGWATASVGFVFNFSSYAGKIAAGSGAFLAVLLVSALTSVSSDSNSTWKKRFAGPVFIFVIPAFLLSWLIPLMINIWTPVSVYFTLIIAEFSDILLKVFSSITLLRLLCSQSYWLGALEALLAAFALSNATSPHRISITRPFWLVDFFVEHGKQAPDAFWIIGVLSAFIFTLILFSHIQPNGSVCKTLMTVSLFFIISALVAATDLFPPLPFIPPPEPPRSQFPKMPPPPQPVALVELLVHYKPTERLRGYYFRTYCHSYLKSDELFEFPEANMDKDVLGDFPSAIWKYNGTDFSDDLKKFAGSARLTEQFFAKLHGKKKNNNIPQKLLSKLKVLKNKEYIDEKELLNDLEKVIGKDNLTFYKSVISDYTKFGTVTAQIHHLDRPERPLCLVSTVGYVPITPRDQRFTIAYEVTAVPPGRITDDLRTGSVRQEFGNPYWTSDVRSYYLRTPDIPKLKELTEKNLSAIQSVYAKYPGPRLAVLENWINQNLTFSSRSESDNPNISFYEFLFDSEVNRTGGAKQFARAAVFLFRAGEIPARMTKGYFYPISQHEIKSTFLITDAHETYWPEVYLNGSGWVPVSLNPAKIIDRTNPQPEYDLEQALSHIKRSYEKNIPVSTRKINFSDIFYYISASSLICLLLVNFWRRSLNVLICLPKNRPRRAFRAAIDLAAIAGFRREYGQNREEFTQELHRQHPLIGKHFSVLTNMYFRSFSNREQFAFSEWYGELSRLGKTVTFLWFKSFWHDIFAFAGNEKGVRDIIPFIRNLNPFCWWNADKPSLIKR